jgi:hypothetical protein
VQKERPVFDRLRRSSPLQGPRVPNHSVLGPFGELLCPETVASGSSAGLNC